MKIAAFMFLMTGVAMAQPDPPAPPPPPPPPGVAKLNFEFVRNEFGGEMKTVKGAPYTAEALTETTQTLADGNRITRKTTSKIARDGEGRVRREETLGAIGPWSEEGEPHKVVTISDPGAHSHYAVSTDKLTVEKLTAENMAMTGALPPPPPGRSEIALITKGFTAMKMTHKGQDEKTESLGQKTIEGLVVDGTRTRTTIAAGSIGNERPIEIVSESWYSAELQTVVMSTRSDPQAGETVYKLTNVQRVEPPHELFDMPRPAHMKLSNESK